MEFKNPPRPDFISTSSGGLLLFYASLHLQEGNDGWLNRVAHLTKLHAGSLFVRPSHYLSEDFIYKGNHEKL